MMNLIAPKQINLSLLSGWVTGVNNSLYLPFTSGDYLWNLITGSDSGTAVNVTGGAPMLFANLSGIGGFQIFQSGDSTILFSGAPNTSGDLTGAFYPLYANPANYATSGDITNLSGVLSGQIHNTGESLLALINSVSGQAPINVVHLTGTETISGVKTFSNQTDFYSGIVTNTIRRSGITAFQIDLGNNCITGSIVGQTLNWSNLQLSGNWLTNTFPSLSGHLINKGYLDSVSGAFGANTGVLTGAFYPLNSNPSGYITSAQTGQFVSTAQTGQFVSTAATGAFVTSGQTGSFVDTNYLGNSGRAYNHISISFFNSYIYTGNSQQEMFVENSFTLTGWKISTLQSGLGTAVLSSGASGIPSWGPMSGEYYVRPQNSPTTTTLTKFSFDSGLYYSSATTNINVSGQTLVGYSIYSGLSGIAGTTLALLGYLN